MFFPSHLFKSALSRALFLFILPTLCFSLSSCFSPEVVTLRGHTMGTTYSIKYVNETNAVNQDLQKGIDDVLIEVNRQMSTYIPTSEISQLNQAEKELVISSWFAEVLQFSLGLAQKTNGVFDPTIGPLVNLWGFGPIGERKIPSEGDIQKALAVTGFQKVELQNANDKWLVKKSLPGVYLDLSATAKGFGVDKVSDFLNQKGLKNHLVEIGGEMRAQGSKNPNNPKDLWRIAIETPTEDSRGIQKVILLKNIGIATSGDYRNFFVKDGLKYSHTINSQTGKPFHHLLTSVSILASTALEADGLATALMALGPEKAWEFALKENVAAYLIIKNENQPGFTVKSSPRFEELLK